MQKQDMAWNEPGRDPWNQNKPGTPGGRTPASEFEELMKRWKTRFGGRGGRGTGSGMPLPSGMFGLLIGAIALLWIASGFYVVDEQERAVVLRFGKYIGTTDPGLRWHVPWPIENEEVANMTGVRSIKDQAVMLTKDENIVDVELSVQYRISKVDDYVFNVDDPDLTLREATKAAVREVVGRSTMDFVLTEGRQVVGEDTKKLLQERLDEYGSGLFVTEVNLQQAQPPKLVQDAFADAIKAREDQQRLKNEAEAYSNDRIPKARGGAARQLAEAIGYRDQTIARAEGDASRFTQLLTEYHKAPKVTRERLYLETMNSILSSSSKVLIDVDKSNPMLYLPLDQLLKRAQDGAAAEQGQTPGVIGQPRNGNDSTRSRERGRP